MASRVALIVLVLAAGALAGCLGDDAADTTIDTSGEDEERKRDGPAPSIEGFVLDAGRLPLAGASVTVQSLNVSTTANATGHYGFFDLVDNELYRLVARADGYFTSTQEVVVVKDMVVRLDFLLGEVPVEEPHESLEERAGLISCQAHVTAGGGHGGSGVDETFACGGATGADPNAVQVLEFSLAPKVVGVVVEVLWENTLPTSEFLSIVTESVGYGDLDTEFGHVVDGSVITIPIPQDAVGKYYTGNGGILRVTVDVHAEEDDENPAGFAAAFQQPFTVGVTSFFVTPNPPSYTAYPDA